MKARWLTATLALASCPHPTSVHTNDVFRLDVDCKAPCTATADGRTTTRVELCPTGLTPHAADLTATLILSRGAWENPPDPTKPQTYVATLPGASCIEVNAISPTDLAPVFIDAQIAGYTHRACIQMLAPPIEDLVVKTNPLSLAGAQQTNIAVTAAVRTATGSSVPAATLVRFSASILPDADLELQPTESTLDGSGMASTSLLTPPGTVSATITATAIVPDGPPCPAQPDPSVDAGPIAPVAADARLGTGELTVIALPDAATPDSPPQQDAASTPDAGTSADAAASPDGM